ncbi:MAG: type IV secretion system DNA-binding domain-containing protein [bacterium]
MESFDDLEIARHVEPPKNIPTPEAAEAAEASFFAETNSSAGLGDDRKVFGVLREDRRRHMYVIGKTGVGKTKLLEHLIRSDIYYGHGICVVDPSGDLVNDLIDFIPKERIGDVIVLNPSDHKNPVAWNPLSNIPVPERHHVVAGIVEVFSRLFGAQWNPRAEHLLRFALLALLDHSEASFVNLLTFIANAEYRTKVLEVVQDGMVKRFWQNDFVNWTTSEDRTAVSALINTLTSFLSHPALHAVFSGAENKIDIEAAVRDGKILLVTVSKGALGDINASIFGSLFLAMFKRAVLRRGVNAAGTRADYYLYVDEFQNVATDSFLALLSEAGRYGVCITASNQYLGQLAPALKHSMLGNVATLISFQVSAEDAAFLEKEFSPQVELRDMINLPAQEFYIKLSIKGRRFDPFSASTLGVDKPKWASERVAIEAACNAKYSRKIDGGK